MRLLAPIVGLGLIATVAACTSEPAGRGAAPPGPTYSRETIRSFEFFGIHLGMEAGAACRVLKEAGFSRGRWVDTDVDCTTFPEEDGDTYFGRGPGAATAHGALRSISFDYELVGGTRRIRGISIYTDEKDQQAALEAAARAEWGAPTYYATWGYTVLNYARSPAQADFYNMSDYGSCLSIGCSDREDAEKCIPVLQRYATATMHLVIYDWGRYIELRDETGADHRDLLEEYAAIRDGRSVHLCAAAPIH